MNLLDIFIFSVNAIMPLILIILIGYFLKQKGFLTKEFLKIGNKLVFRLCLPVLLFCNIVELDSLSGIPWMAVLYVLAIIFILIVIGFIIAKFTPDPNQKGVMMQCIFRSNFALIGVPLAELIGGSAGVTAAAILSVVTIPIYNIVAVIVLTVFKGGEASGSIKAQLKNILKNPLIIGVFSGFVVLLLKLYVADYLPQRIFSDFKFVGTTLSYISRSATPLSLIVLGGQFEFSKIKGFKKQLITGTLGRTVIAPLIGIGVAVVLNKLGILYFKPAVFAALIALFATPVAVASAIMAEEMQNDGQLAAQLVVWTSLISVFTLFIFIFLSRLFGVL